MNEKNDRYVGYDGVERLFGIKKATLYALVHAKRIPHIRTARASCASRSPHYSGGSKNTRSTRPEVAEMTNANLSQAHAAMLRKSGISDRVIAARGYRTVEREEELAPLGFVPVQRRVPTLVVPIHGVMGDIVLHQHRPGEPRLNAQGKTIKYETRSRARMALDVPPLARAQLGNPRVPLIITEGAKKADAAVSHGLCCIGLMGVWNFRGSNEFSGKIALPDWENVALNDREVSICFDSDVMTKAAVQQALSRLKAFLDRRHAKTSIIYLPEGADGEKMGLDDYLAAGNSSADLQALATSKLRAGPRGAEGAEGKKSQATRCIEIAREHCELWHSGQDAFATLQLEHHVEHHRVNDRPFRQWLTRSLFAATESCPSDTTVRDACSALAGIAVYDGPEHPVGVRLAGDHDRTVLDLVDERWRSVEVDPSQLLGA